MTNLVTILKGAEFIDEKGDIVFKDGPEQDMTYRSWFGPGPAQAGVIYGNSRATTQMFARRLTGVREPGTDQHYVLLENQHEFMAANKEWLLELGRQRSAHLPQWTGLYNEALEHHNDPHVKRMLRYCAWLDMDMENLSATDDWGGIEKVIFKLKASEIAKYGKKPRGIVNLGVARSLKGWRLAGAISHSMTMVTIMDEDTHYQIVKSARYDLLTTVFDKLINPTTRRFVAIFSDDSCVTTLVDGVISRKNMDIKSCDASHSTSSFKGFICSVPPKVREETEEVLQQLDLPITIKDPTIGSKDKVVAKFKDRRLYSGSTFTTPTNHQATLTCVKSMSLDDAISNEEIKAATRKAGWIVTLESTYIVQAIQFLKNSPAYDVDGVLRHVLNFGVLMRASGCCRGDLPGRGDLVARARMFQYGLILGMYPRVSCPLLEAMKDATGRPRICKEVQNKVAKLMLYRPEPSPDTLFFTDREFLARYELTPSEFLFVTEVIAHCQPGDMYHHPAAEKILQKDYGLGLLIREQEVVLTSLHLFR